MKKRFIIFALVCICSLAFITIGASAETYGALTFEISNGEITITGCDDSVTSVDIPAKIGGYPVTSIGRSAFEGCAKLTSITLPESLTVIQANAFYGCKSLLYVHISDLSAYLNCEYHSDPMNYAKSLYLDGELLQGEITIPDDVTQIPRYAFKNQKITSVTIPESVASIGNCSFKNCTSLTSITLSEGLTSIGEEAFYGCTSLTSITIPNSVTSIKYYTFYKCTSLASVTLPNSLTSIVRYAFKNCTSLTGITIPEGVISIGRGAFEDCTGLTSVTIASSVTSVGEEAFKNCENIESVYISDLSAYLNCEYGDTYYSNPMHYAEQLYLDGELLQGEITIPDGVTQIPCDAFKNQKVTSVTIPDSVISIGEDAFFNCKGLAVNITDVGAWCKIEFDDSWRNACTYDLYLEGELVTDLVIPESVTSIGKAAFSHCRSLTSVAIPDGVTSIQERTFQGAGLSSITIPESVTSIRAGAFADTDLTDIKLPEGLTEICGNWYWGGAFENCTSLRQITIPDGVTSIQDRTFYGCTSLSSITLSEGLRYIREEAFYGCSSLTSITLPDSFETIVGAFPGKGAFENCTNLTSIVIPATMRKVGSYAFSGCDALTTVYCDGESGTIEIEISTSDKYAGKGNAPLLNAEWRTYCRVILIDENKKTRSVICEPGETISIAQIEDIYQSPVTLYIDEALRYPFDLSAAITAKTTLYIKLGEELVGATLNGQVNSYHPQRETVIRLLQNGEEKYSVTIPAEASGSGQVTQAFSIPEVAEGTYDLVVSKAGHLAFTIRGVVMGAENLDLTANSNAAISTITLLAGDLNGDGSINTKDRTALNRNLNLAGSDIIEALADINGDGLVNSKDRTILKKNLNKSAENDCIINY